MLEMKFESKLRCSRLQVWDWITSLDGISTELWPYFRMTAPKNIRKLSDVKINPGVRLFRSWVYLFGFIPIDYSDLTLVEMTDKRGFKEQSPMGSMRLWRHEREIVDCANDQSSVTLVDKLTFEPRIASSVVGWFIRKVFEHRHRVLRSRLK
jgi:hypothetical protein